MKTASATQRPDRALLRNTLMRLTMPQKLLSIVVTLVVALIWWPLLQRRSGYRWLIFYSALRYLCMVVYWAALHAANHLHAL